MKKAYLKGALAALGVGMLAVSAQAADVKIYPSGDTDDGTGVFNIANEAYDTNSGVSITNGGNIMLITNKNNQPDSLKIYMSNGQLENAAGSYKLNVWADTGNGQIDVGELTPVTDDGGNDVTGAVSNGVLTFTPAGTYIDIAPNSKLVIVDTAAGAGASASVGFDWSVAPGLDADSTINVTVVESEGAPTEDTTTTPFAQLINQYVFCADTGGWPSDNYMTARTDLGVDPVSSLFVTWWGDATSTTDVSQNYQLFDRNSTDTSSYNNCDSKNYTSTFIVTQGIGGGSISKVKYTLNASDEQISKATDGSNDLTYSSGGWTQEIAALNASYNFTVNGTESITLRDFSMDIVSVPASGYNAITYANGVKAGEWTSQGYVGRIPYMIFGYEGYSCFLKVNNMHSTTAAEISVTAQVANQTDGTDEVVTASLGTVEPKTLKHISKDEIATALGLDSNKQYHVAMKISVSAPSDDIDVAAFQSSPTGRTDIPVYIVQGTNQ